jgi:hypothetical protein
MLLNPTPSTCVDERQLVYNVVRRPVALVCCSEDPPPHLRCILLPAIVSPGLTVAPGPCLPLVPASEFMVSFTENWHSSFRKAFNSVFVF